jgi:uncharacterized membrane protein
VIFLFSGFAFLGLFFLIAALSDADSLCAADERTNAAVCVRNWVNAAGNLIAVVGAFLATAFAYRQYREAHRQTAIARLPMAEAALLVTRQIGGTLMGSTVALSSMREAVGAIMEELSSDDPDLDHVLVSARHYSSMDLQMVPHIKTFQNTWSERVLDNALRAAILPSWFESAIVLLEVERLSTHLRALAEGGTSLEDGKIDYKILHDLVMHRETLADLVAALTEAARLSRAMSDSVTVLRPSFEAARDSLLDVVGRS